MSFLSWNMPLSKTVRLLDNENGRELFYYGISIGWVGLGVVVGRMRQPTKRAADLCQACGSSLVSGTTPKNGKQSCPVCGTSR